MQQPKISEDHYLFFIQNKKYYLISNLKITSYLQLKYKNIIKKLILFLTYYLLFKIKF